MAALVIQQIDIYDDDPAGSGTSQNTMKNVMTDDITLDKEGNVVTVDNGREINESFSGTIEFRVRSSDFDGGTAILSSSYISSDGTLPTEGWLKVVGRSNSFDINIGPIYINGWEDYSNGRLETVLRATLTEVDQSDTMTSATATGS